MILTRRVALGSAQLDEIHSAIVIRRVDTGVPHEAVGAVNRMGGFGQRMTMHHWETLEVGVAYAIDVPKRQLALRREIFDAVNTWALQGGWLTTTSQPGKRMWAEKTVIPSSGDLWDWTDEYTITFRAYGVPFWQDAEATTVTDTLTEDTVLINVGGNVESVLDATFENTSGSTINTFSISAGGNTLNLSDLGLGNGETLTITHGTDGLLRILAGNTNVLNKRSGSDDLYVKPGARTVTVSAGGEGELTVSSIGRYV